MLWFTLAQVDPWLMGSRLRSAACAETYKHICYEVGSVCKVPAPAWQALAMLA